MNAIIPFGIVTAAAVVLTAGCGIPQERYDHLQTSHRTLTEENIILQDKLEAQETTNRLLQQRLADASSQVGQLERQNQQLSGDVETMRGNYATLEEELNNLEFILPREVNTQLQALAAQHPGLLTYDPQQGMLRFASDLTFDLGSADLKPAARDTITKLATILNDQSITNYEVHVVGHTDSVPIVNPGTKERHPTNTHLSVHRAISVADALRAASVDSRRVQVAGWGPHRPLVAEASGGAAANRRVEIYITPMTASLGNAPASSATAPASAKESIEPMK